MSAAVKVTRCLFVTALFVFINLFYGLEAVLGQDSQANTTRYDFSSSLYSAGGSSLPFWMHSNINGKVDPSGVNWLNELSAEHRLLSNKDLSASLGGQAVFRLSENSTAFLPRLYLRIEGYGYQLDLGRFDQPIGLNNHELSSGSMMVSHNAVPVPKISISNPDFMDVPYADGYLQYKGMFSHGWFEEDRHVESPYLHQKYLYLRLNIGSWSGTGGILHNVQWGGTDPDRGPLPRSFNDYVRVVTGLGADEDSNVPGGEVSNVIGNSVAAYEFGLQYEHETFIASLTRLFYLEDKVSTRFRSPWDGMWGANLEIEDGNWLKAVTYEHINTKQQDARSDQLIGRANYYNHSIYGSGWRYEGRTLGTPLILFEDDFPFNNVLVGHHAGVKGKIANRLEYQTLLTYSRNYGNQRDWVRNGGSRHIPKDSDNIIPREQFRKDQYSVLMELGYDVRSIRGLSMDLKLSADLGELYEDRLGVMLGFRWSNDY